MPDPSKSGLLACFLVIVIVGGAALLVHFSPRALVLPFSRPLTERQFAATPERVARGKYLVEGVAHCFGCHSPFDPNTKTGEPTAEQAGIGDSFEPAPGVTIVLPNLTPDPGTGIGRWSDDQLPRHSRRHLA